MKGVTRPDTRNTFDGLFVMVDEVFAWGCKSRKPGSDNAERKRTTFCVVRLSKLPPFRHVLS